MNWLDLENQKILNAILKNLSSKSLIMISNHNMSLVENLCDRVIILNQDIKYFGEINNINIGSIIKLKVICDAKNIDSNIIKELVKIEGVLSSKLYNSILYIEFDSNINNVENNIISCIISKYKVNIHKINRIEKNLEDLYFEKVR